MHHFALSLVLECLWVGIGILEGWIHLSHHWIHESLLVHHLLSHQMLRHLVRIKHV